METLKLTVRNPFDLHYDPTTRVLTLTHDETWAGHRQVEIRFDAEATRALFDLLGAAASVNGGTLGSPSPPRSTQ
jgi:hypothetical protein